MLPFSMLAVAVAWLPFGVVFNVSYMWVVAIFATTGPLLFFRPFQVAVLTPVLGARLPTEEETATIKPLWEEITRAAGRDHNLASHRYVVRILPSDELNAFACGGHLVVVTSYAVNELSPDELRGVLAHELSHHIGRHTVATTVSHWLSAPVVLLAQFGFFLERVGLILAENYERRNVGVERLSRVVAFLMRLVGILFSSGLRMADVLANLVGHDAEFEADRRAAAMGFGRELITALQRILSIGHSKRPIGWRARLAASHPPARTRIARIEAFLRHSLRETL